MDVGYRYENGVLFENPVRPLPEEMLAEIFLHCVEYNELFECLPSLTSPPLTLTWVCRYWRRLAISIPGLWTSISLGERGSDPADDVHLLDLWAERSGPTNKMHISLCHEMKNSERPVFLDPNRGGRYLVGMKVLTDKLLSISHRWQTLDLHALDLYVLDEILRALVTKGTPYLETFSISTRYCDSFGSVYFMDVTNCPALRSLRLLSPMLCPTSSSNVMAKLMNLEIRYCPLMRDCLTWLSICPNLERLNVRFFRALSSSLPRDMGPLTLPRLTRLSMSCHSDDSDPSPLLDLLLLPALQDLSLDMTTLALSEVSQTWSDRMFDIIKRSGTYLERLVMLGTPTAPDVLIQLLESTPRLKELVLSGLVISDKVLESLATNMKSPTTQSVLEDTMLEDKMTFSLCPGLESLELREFQGSLNALVSLIYARCRAVGSPRKAQSIYKDDSSVCNTGSLRSLTLIWSPHATLLDHPLVRECVAGGLEIMNRAYNTGKLL